MSVVVQLLLEVNFGVSAGDGVGRQISGIIFDRSTLYTLVRSFLESYNSKETETLFAVFCSWSLSVCVAVLIFVMASMSMSFFYSCEYGFWK